MHGNWGLMKVMKGNKAVNEYNTLPAESKKCNIYRAFRNKLKKFIEDWFWKIQLIYDLTCF